MNDLEGKGDKSDRGWRTEGIEGIEILNIIQFFRVFEAKSDYSSFWNPENPFRALAGTPFSVLDSLWKHLFLNRS